MHVQDQTRTLIKKQKNKREKQNKNKINRYKKTHTATLKQERFDSKINDWASWNNLTLIWKSVVEIPFNSQSIFFLSEAQCHLFPSNCAAEVNNFSRMRAAKRGQYRK